ncbi:MAG: hypothetical protein A2X28_07175 [Elusimicrobia bacterium GWA2_56_46]|nr:MAG: hypothetical protein A2X28_07175 [Elusimicrobia bacterium GWA2_56_46]OGR54773.1 MAG: hypothetical protein A2X39_10815 [Elusimicrobia bacterium GWC2_56_31]HBB67391.1 hypothetical protein [Elusimicrobiota bacterium]HBW23436.1 hypothetical protein [Elusimicrobiota bacterium]
MFTKQDYVKYFLQIKKIEDSMSVEFLRCAEKLEDPEMKELFMQLHKEEMAHNKLADSMLEMFRDK